MQVMTHHCMLLSQLASQSHFESFMKQEYSTWNTCYSICCCLPHCSFLHAAAAYLLLLDLGINFVRYFVSEPWHKRCLWTGSKQLNDLRAAVDSFLLYLGSAHDKYLSAEDPTITLKVGLHLQQWQLCRLHNSCSCCWLGYRAYLLRSSSCAAAAVG